MSGQSFINLNQESLENGEIRFFGLDYSLNHFSLLCMDKDYKVLDYVVGSVKKKEVEALKDKGHYIDFDEEDSDRASFYRGFSTVSGISKFIQNYTSSYVNVIVIENYAFSANSSRLLQLAEWMGVIKSMLWGFRFYIRLIDPTSVKLFATGKGNALKKDIVESAKSCGFEVEDCLLRDVKKKKKVSRVDVCLADLDGVGTDLADSYFLAKIGVTEVLLRFGIKDLKELSDHERRIYMRVTKGNPVNILDKEFISQ